MRIYLNIAIRGAQHQAERGNKAPWVRILNVLHLTMEPREVAAEVESTQKRHNWIQTHQDSPGMFARHLLSSALQYVLSPT